MPDLVVVPTAASLPSPPAPGRAEALLVLDEGRLTTPDGGVLDVRPQSAVVEIACVAQSVAEAALAHLMDVGDPSRVAAARVAAMAKLTVFADVASFLRAAHALRRAIEATNPGTVRWWADQVDLARAVGTQVAAGRRLEVTHRPLRSEGWRTSAIASLKRARVDALARALSTLPEVRAARPTDRPPRVLGVFDVRNEGMIANVEALVGHCRGQGDPVAAVYMERRVGRRIRSALGPIAPLPLASFGRPADLVRAARAAAAVRRGAAAIVRAAGGEDVLTMAAARYAADRLRVVGVWQALVDQAAVGRSLDHLRPDAVLVASDAHWYARAYVAAARDRGITTAVLQHGALAFEHFYVPLVADRMLAWGPWCRDWFVDRGVDAARVAAAGCVRAPPRRPLRIPSAPPHRWLFAAQPVPDAVTRALLDRIQGALRVHPAARLVVRPHPGESRRGTLDALLATWEAGLRARVDVSPAGRRLADDLAAADVCLVSQSTVGIDALVAGVPVVVLAHERVAERVPFRSFGAVLTAGTASQLADAITALGSADAAAGLARGADAFLDAYLGRSAEAALAAAREALFAPRPGPRA